MLEHDFKLSGIKSNDPLISNSFNYQPINPFNYNNNFIQNQYGENQNQLHVNQKKQTSNITNKSNPILSNKCFNNDSEEDDINWENLL